MNASLQFGRARAVVYVCIFVMAALVWTVNAQQQPPPAGQSGNFTGGTVTTLKAEGRLSYYIFAQGTRTKWHSHEGGQLLLAEEGRGRTQMRGEPVRELREGEAVWSPPGVTHWHGGSPDASATLYQISRGTTIWMEEVTDEDYRGTPGR